MAPHSPPELPEALADLAAAWRMFPPQGTAFELKVLRHHRGELLLVGACGSAPRDLDDLARAVIDRGGSVVSSARDLLAVFDTYSLIVTDTLVALYRCLSEQDALVLLLTHGVPRGRGPVPDAAVRRQALASAADDAAVAAAEQIALARRRAGAHRTIAAALKSALEPLATHSNELVAELASTLLAQQQQQAADAESDLAAWERERHHPGSSHSEEGR